LALIDSKAAETCEGDLESTNVSKLKVEPEDNHEGLVPPMQQTFGIFHIKIQ
jgi:hypothetical protein